MVFISSSACFIILIFSLISSSALDINALINSFSNSDVNLSISCVLNIALPESLINFSSIFGILFVMTSNIIETNLHYPAL
jgi:hypothetical protein